MTETADWQPTFEAARRIPGGTKQRPSQKDWEELKKSTEFSRKRYASDIAVAMGAVDTGDEFDPLSEINEITTNQNQSSADLKRETDAIAAGLAQLQADVKANNNSGKSFIVAVSDYGTSIPSVFDLVADTGSGAIFNDGNTLQMSNNTGREVLGYNVEPLATNYFEVSLVVPKQSGAFGSSYGDRCLFFIGGADETFDNYRVARLNGNKLRIGAVLDGVSTLDSPTWFGPEVTITPGTYMTFRGGTISSEFHCQFLVNNQVRANFIDAGEVSLIGDDYRWTACAIQNSAVDIINRSASVSHFMANDNAPALVSGSIGHMYRTSTTQVAVTAGVNPLPTSFFGLLGEVSPDIIPDLTAGTLTVTESRPYVITASARTGTSWVNHFMWVLYRNGLPDRYFPMPDVMWGSNALGGTIKPDLVGATLSVHGYAGDEFGLGYEVDGTAGNILRGEAAGQMTYFTVVGVH